MSPGRDILKMESHPHFILVRGEGGFLAMKLFNGCIMGFIVSLAGLDSMYVASSEKCRDEGACEVFKCLEFSRLNFDQTSILHDKVFPQRPSHPLPQYVVSSSSRD